MRLRVSEFLDSYTNMRNESDVFDLECPHRRPDINLQLRASREWLSFCANQDHQFVNHNAVVCLRDSIMIIMEMR